MKVFLVGIFQSQSLELCYERALKILGCQVMRFELIVVNRFLTPYYEYIINKKIFNDLYSFRPDLILVMKGYYLCPKTIRKLKELKKSLIFCFNPDNPFNLASRGASNRNILYSISYYDCYFIWKRSLIDSLLKAGTKKVEYLPFGYDPYMYHPINPLPLEQRNLGNDIVFVGNWDREREKWLKELVDFDLGLWGTNYWKTRCRNKDLRKKWHRRAIYGEGMSKVLNASKICLNILREQNKKSHNMRTFEGPGCGAFVLAESSPEAKEFFEEDKEAVYFSTPEELKDKIRYYLSHERERKQIAQAGYERCITSGYSYLERAKSILKVYEEMKN